MARVWLDWRVGWDGSWEVCFAMNEYEHFLYSSFKTIININIKNKSKGNKKLGQW
jgi:hypothetical protein